MQVLEAQGWCVNYVPLPTLQELQHMAGHFSSIPFVIQT